jgi:hypothetical protein
LSHWSRLSKVLQLENVRFLCPFAVQSDEEVGLAQVDHIAVIPDASPAAAFTLIASPEAWDEFAKPVPAIGYQSIVAMVGLGYLSVEGGMLEFGRHLLFLKQLFAALRPKSEPEARGSGRA